MLLFVPLVWRLAVGETGWPTAGHPVATVTKAAAWNTALLGKVQSTQGTPKRPGKALRAFLFEAFDEDLKGGGAEEPHWGALTVDGTPKYAINLKQRYPAPPVATLAL